MRPVTPSSAGSSGRPPLTIRIHALLPAIQLNLYEVLISSQQQKVEAGDEKIGQERALLFFAIRGINAEMMMQPDVWRSVQG